MKTNRLAAGTILAVLMAGCGGGDVTRGDIYSACVEGHMRDFDMKADLVIRLVDDNEKQETERVWARERLKKSTDVEKACECTADTLPDRMASDRLSKVIAFYKSQGTLAANGKFKALTETEQAEVSKCMAQVAVERMRSEGRLD